MKLNFKLISLTAVLAAMVSLGAVNAQMQQLFLPVVSATLAGQPCPESVHARHETRGPDGKLYPTWHPQIDPFYKCFFSHEHGDDPARSLADASLPAFGYIGLSAGMNEPHAGFKVFVINKGETNNEGRIATTHTRAVAHMGTSGIKRFTERMHSLEFDMVAPDSGHAMHIQGIADTGLAGDICQRDAGTTDSDQTNDVGRVFFILPGQTACTANGSYEIWKFRLVIKDRAEANVSTAAFDTATMMDPSDVSRLLPTGKAGCSREAYHGPAYWTNLNSPVVFYTDAFGNTGGTLRQEVSNHRAIGIRMNGDQNQMKMLSNHCAPGIFMPN